jgi:hypothetical protein
MLCHEGFNRMMQIMRCHEIKEFFLLKQQVVLKQLYQIEVFLQFDTFS